MVNSIAGLRTGVSPKGKKLKPINGAGLQTGGQPKRSISDLVGKPKGDWYPSVKKQPYPDKPKGDIYTKPPKTKSPKLYPKVPKGDLYPSVKKQPYPDKPTGDLYTKKKESVKQLPHALQPNPKGDSTMEKAKKMRDQFKRAGGFAKSDMDNTITQDMGMGKSGGSRSKSKQITGRATQDMGMGKRKKRKRMTHDMGMGKSGGLRSKLRPTRKDKLPTMKKF